MFLGLGCGPHSQNNIEEFLQSIAVARHSVVVVVAPELQVQRSEQFLQRSMTTLLAPLGEVQQRVAELLARCPPLQMRFASAILSPVQLKPKQVEPYSTRLRIPPEANHPPLGSAQFKPELLHTTSHP